MPPSSPDPAAGQDDLLALAVLASQRGGAAVMNRLYRPGEVRYKSSATDPVTDADRASEEAVTGLIRARRPDDGLLSEEGSHHASASGLRWVVDALDGTVNYLYGIPHCAISVAVEQRRGNAWHPLVGVVHDPVRNETFTAVRGGGARLDGRELRVTEPVPLSRALVATEFAYQATSRQRQAASVCRILAAARDIRSNGSSALDLCWTAAGRFDGFYEDELGPWDWAAGQLIVTEAGGIVTPLGRGVLAAGPALHRDLVNLLIDADRRP